MALRACSDALMPRPARTAVDIGARAPARLRVAAAALALTACLLAACARDGDRRSRFEVSGAGPRGGGRGLVVLLVIDQWPQWAFAAHRHALRGGGFDRLLSEGAWRVGRYPYASTLTAPGHATLGTGVTPSAHGIVANDWWRRDAGRALASVRAASGEVSLAALRAPALGDALAAAGKGGKAVAVSLKDRAALLPLGRRGTAIWYQARTVDWVSNAPSPWLARENQRAPVALHLHDVWTPLDEAELRRLSGRRDSQPGELGDKGFGPSFPHALDLVASPAEAVLATPLGNQLVLDTALAAIDGEGLGADEVPDLLVVSLSAHDYIAHAWGHESWESWDGELRLDRALAAFLAELDRKVGATRWAMVVTSDHGASPLPELTGGGRTSFSLVAQRAELAAARVLGPGTWIAWAKAPTVYLTDAALAHPLREAAVRAIADELRALPGVAYAEATAALVGDCATRAELAAALCRSLSAQASGEVAYVPTRHWIFEDEHEPMAVSHGSPYDYDQQVPLITLPFGRRRGATAMSAEPTEVAMTEVAGLVARWLEVPAPATLPPPAR